MAPQNMQAMNTHDESAIEKPALATVDYRANDALGYKKTILKRKILALSTDLAQASQILADRAAEIVNFASALPDECRREEAAMQISTFIESLYPASSALRSRRSFHSELGQLVANGIGVNCVPWILILTTTGLLTLGASLKLLRGTPMPQQMIDLHVNPSEEIIHVGPLTVRFLLTGDNSTGSIAVFETVVPGTRRLPVPAHSHDHYEETIYGIDGVLTWTVGGKQIDVGPGQALCIPRGAIHRFDNNGINVKALCVITPAAIGPQYFRESAEVIKAAAGGAPDRVKMAEIMRRHGLTPAPPQG
jgi:quercetin dioxygenase-like cupin family protein